MRYLILLLLLTAGCSTVSVSDYEQGCRDGLKHTFQQHGDNSEQLDNLTVSTCNAINNMKERRMERLLRDHGGGKNRL